MPKNVSTALTGQLRRAIKTFERATTPEEQAAALAFVQEANMAIHAERTVRNAKIARRLVDLSTGPAVSKRIQHSGASERLSYLERAERGGAVNRSHCPPFEPVGRRLQREGLLTLQRRPVAGSRCSHSIVVLTPAGAQALAKLRKRLGVSAQVLAGDG